MCGLAGFTISKDARDHRAIAEAMLAEIAHRGPDEQDILVRERLVFGHNRLTIMEPDGGQQPRVNPGNGNVLIFNGEIYGYRSFDAELQAAGCELRDHCDTETLFWLLETQGVAKTLSRVDGMFAFAWYDAQNDELTIARDRFGQKPMFYAEIGGQFVYASEIKALRRHPALAAITPDLDALRCHLLMEYVPAPATGIKEIRELPAGHVLRYRQGQLQLAPYWRASDVQRNAAIDDRAAATGLDGALQSAVQQQLVADAPLGVFLSGGIDSSMIAAIAKRHRDDVATFTVRFPYAGFDESEHAAAVAKHLGTRHTTVELDRQNCIDGLEYLLEQADQPFADSSLLPSYLLCKATRQHVTVALGGDGADELLLGYPNFRLLRAARLMAALPRFTGSILRGIAKLLPLSTAYMNKRFLLQQLSYGIGHPAHQQSICWMAPLPPPDQHGLWRDGRGARIERAADPDRSLLEQCQLQFIEQYLAGDILQKMDRASMYTSLEVRSPFLSNAVADFALSLPLATLHRSGTGKRVLRTVAIDYLPESTITRRKHGFGLPVSALLQTELRDLAADVLLDPRNAMFDYIDFAAVRKLWQGHVNRRAEQGKALWALLMLAAFFRKQF